MLLASIILRGNAFSPGSKDDDNGNLGLQNYFGFDMDTHEEQTTSNKKLTPKSNLPETTNFSLILTEAFLKEKLHFQVDHESRTKIGKFVGVTIKTGHLKY